MILIKNYNKKIDLYSFNINKYSIFCFSLQTTFAANQTINDTSPGGILGGVGNASAGDTVFLQPGTYNKVNQDTNITINKNITIQGNGSTDKVIIDAQKLSRIFSMGDGYNVSFINITFINANSTGIF